MTDAAATDPMTGFRLLGRFLTAGVGAGLVIGAVVGALAVYTPGDPEYGWVAGLSFGAVLGMPAGLVGAVVIHVLLHVLRRIRSGVPLGSQRWVIVTLASVAAFCTTWIVLQYLDAPMSRSILLTGVAVGLTAPVAAMASAWCLVPLYSAGLFTRDERPERSTADDCLAP